MSELVRSAGRRSLWTSLLDECSSHWRRKTPMASRLVSAAERKQTVLLVAELSIESPAVGSAAQLSA